MVARTHESQFREDPRPKPARIMTRSSGESGIRMERIAFRTGERVG